MNRSSICRQITTVAQFQQKYGKEILALYGLKYGSGNVGNTTKKIESNYWRKVILK
jgi:hypothetical protein